ncbi:MAG: PTS glucose/sucrose transporter subunit IIB [Atopobiaceae bacterium]|jgi:hypothetical protein|nr:PTS glucose/sucrose transporter subunit IIB [Atopobiaceae bacterium]
MTDNERIAAEVLDAVGGKDNITSIAHCMTRLRINLKDESVPDDDRIKAIKGVVGWPVSGHHRPERSKGLRRNREARRLCWRLHRREPR